MPRILAKPDINPPKTMVVISTTINTLAYIVSLWGDIVSLILNVRAKDIAPLINPLCPINNISLNFKPIPLFFLLHSHAKHIEIVTLTSLVTKSTANKRRIKIQLNLLASIENIERPK